MKNFFSIKACVITAIFTVCYVIYMPSINTNPEGIEEVVTKTTNIYAPADAEARKSIRNIPERIEDCEFSVYKRMEHNPEDSHIVSHRMYLNDVTLTYYTFPKDKSKPVLTSSITISVVPEVKPGSYSLSNYQLDLSSKQIIAKIKYFPSLVLMAISGLLACIKGLVVLAWLIHAILTLARCIHNTQTKQTS